MLFIDKLRPLAEIGSKNRDICEELTGQQSLPDENGTTMKLPSRLGGMGIRAVTSQVQVSYGLNEKIRELKL